MMFSIFQINFGLIENVEQKSTENSDEHYYQISDYEHELENDGNEEEVDQIEIEREEWQTPNSKPSLLKILRHYAAYTCQKQDDMTYLLKLLKTHEPDPHYSMLPSTGKELVKIDGRDWPSNGTSKKLPSPIRVGVGKYVHFGLENALNGESAGIVHRDSDLLQFVDIYVEEPNLLPKPIIKRVCLY